MPIGQEIIEECPIGILSRDALFIIDAIEWSDESGIPWEGTCLADQTEKYRIYRSLIKSEQGKVKKEIDQLTKTNAKAPPRPSSRSRPRAPVRRR